MSITVMTNPLHTRIGRSIITVVAIAVLSFLVACKSVPANQQVLKVYTSYKGANAREIENNVTDPLERSIGEGSGIKSLTSFSSEDLSTIIIEFEQGFNIETAFPSLQTQLKNAYNQLPVDADFPSIQKATAHSGLVIYFQSENISAYEATRIVEEVYMKHIKTIPGVSAVQLRGQEHTAIHLRIDTSRLALFRLTLPDITKALSEENIKFKSVKQPTEFIILARENNTAAELLDLRIKNQQSEVIELKDIGMISEESTADTVVHRNRFRSLALGVSLQAGAKGKEVADLIQQRLNQIGKDTPVPPLGYELSFLQADLE
jgi:multidrug efflux pump